MAELTVKKDAIVHNYRAYTEGGAAIPMLKDNACGLGMEKVAELLYAEGARLFAVSMPQDACRLAELGYDAVLLSCLHDPDVLRKLAEKQVIAAVESLEQARLFGSFGIPARVHLAVDTGFGRFGFRPSELEEMKQVFALPNVQVCGIFSHFRSPGAAPEQFAVFTRVLDGLKDYDVGIRHIAATSTGRDPRYRLDAVRVGTALTGRVGRLERAAELTATVCTVRHLPKGSRVSYSATKLRRDTDIAVIDLGTGDGAFLRRCCGPRDLLYMIRKKVVLNGKQVKVIDAPGLTHTMLDVTGLGCKVGDRVTYDQTPALVNPLVPRRYI